MWRDRPQGLALLELMTTGELPLRAEQAAAWRELGILGLARRTGRQKVLALDPAHRQDVEALLDRCWPAWRDTLEALEQAGLPPTPAGLRDLQTRERRQRLPADLAGRLNRRTARALVGGDSKGAPVEIPQVDITQDFLVRLRPHEGLRVRRGREVHRGRDLAALLGEVVVTSRALQDGTVVEGDPPRALLTVENQGPYLDLPAPEGWLVALLPGWDTRPTGPLLAAFPGVPWIHFGDLDPNGVRILRELRRLDPRVRWFVPDFWAELGPRPYRRGWPEDLVNPEDPPLVRRLAARGEWLEQEPVAVDPRLVGALLAQVQEEPTGRTAPTPRESR